MSKSITITDNVVVEFYEKNSHIDVVAMNRLLIDIISSLSTDLSKTLENSKLGQIDSMITELKEEIHEIKKEYTEEVKGMLNTNSLENIGKITSLVERNTTNLIEKTTNILNDVIPKNQTSQQEHIEHMIKEFHNSISTDTKKILESNERDDTSIHNLIEGIDNKFNNLSTQLQQPLFSFISASEERMKTDIDTLKESSSLQAREQEKLSSEIMEFLNKYKHSTNAKGAISENILYGVLQSIFPSDEIIDSRTETASGDFMINRKDPKLPTIMIENKDYGRSVDTREVVKFERDIQQKKCHGIFLSQSSPITFKDPYQIDVIEGFIHVYVPNVEFNMEKIKIAVDIIDNLAPALHIIEENYAQDNTSISKAELEMLTNEFKKWGEKRNETLELVKQTLANIEEMTFPCVQSILISSGKLHTSSSLTCQFCKNYTGKSKQSLAAHSRKCKLNPKSPLYEPPQPQVIDNLELV